MTSNLSNDLKQRVRTEIIKEWLQRRLEFLEDHKNELEITEEKGLLGDLYITKKKVFNRDDGELLLVIDDRFKVLTVKTDIDKLYEEIYLTI